MKKIVLVGCGAVGNSFIYSALNQGLAQEYVLIDKFQDIAKGNALDFSDTQAALENSFSSVEKGDYSDAKDADLVVITAGRPQLPGETRLNMVADNAKIMKDIALQIKASGFNGITIIASNPVDVMTAVYQKVTGFDVHKVLGSGTSLDTLRAKYLLGQKLKINSKSISAYVLGEHGDSSFVSWNNTTIANKTINQLIAEKTITLKELNEIEKEVHDRAYQIINLKRATFYGIGAALACLVRTIKQEQNIVTIAGAYLNGEYGCEGLYIGVPVTLNQNGWKQVIELSLTKEEQIKFNTSCKILKDTLKVAFDTIKE